jgi:flagellum-specific ATP synthase
MRAAARFRQLWSVYEENRDLVLMGAYSPGNDPALDEAIARRSEMLDFLRQPQHQMVSLDAARAALVGAFA